MITLEKNNKYINNIVLDSRKEYEYHLGTTGFENRQGLGKGVRIFGHGKSIGKCEEVRGFSEGFSGVGGLEAVELLLGGGKGLAGSESRVGGVVVVCGKVDVGVGEKV